MSDTPPTPTPTPVPVPAPQPVQDVFTQRVTTITAAIAFLAGSFGLIWVMLVGDPQTSSIAMGFVGGTLVGVGASFFMRGRVENPSQTRPGPLPPEPTPEPVPPVVPTAVRMGTGIDPPPAEQSVSKPAGGAGSIR